MLFLSDKSISFVVTSMTMRLVTFGEHYHIFLGRQRYSYSSLGATNTLNLYRLPPKSMSLEVTLTCTKPGEDDPVLLVSQSLRLRYLTRRQGLTILVIPINGPVSTVLPLLTVWLLIHLCAEDGYDDSRGSEVVLQVLPPQNNPMMASRSPNSSYYRN